MISKTHHETNHPSTDLNNFIHICIFHFRPKINVYANVQIKTVFGSFITIFFSLYTICDQLPAITSAGNWSDVSLFSYDF